MTVKVKVRNSTNESFKIEKGRNEEYDIVSRVKPGATCRLPVEEAQTHEAFRLVRLSDNKEYSCKYTGQNLIDMKDKSGFKELVIKMVEGSDPPDFTWEESYY